MNNRFRYKLLAWYCAIFYLLMLYKWANGMLLYQLQPAFFYTRQDLVTWLFMQTGLHKWLLNNPAGWLVADVLFYSMPLLVLAALRKSEKLCAAAAFMMLLVNWCYVQCYTLYPTNSVEGHVAWLLFPVLFMLRKPRGFALLFQGLRYFFLYLLVSAAVWKIAQGGIFNIRQMSGVLLYQHNQLINLSPGYWQSVLYLWLINHPAVSYLLYFAAFVCELCFVAGFFTRRFDRWLAIIFILFLVMDYLIMRIPYFEWLPFLLLLLMKDRDATYKNI
ncbi:hypothetical protein [Foetidibacter luteolus]|uniref:hypothetical protein n=1 Tax=Foetidibacter luteolus TaxID=2608880 RepID=UPI00129A7727|nr:hypothetical protein [Foetidibacter luteolus]